MQILAIAFDCYSFTWKSLRKMLNFSPNSLYFAYTSPIISWDASSTWLLVLNCMISSEAAL